VDRAPQTRRAEASAEPAPRRRSPRTQHGVVAVDEPPTPSLADGRDDILGAAAGLSRIAPGVVPVPVRAVEGSRIQRRIVDGPDQPTSEFDVQRIRLAISELPDAQAASRVLQPLLDDDVDHPVGDVLAQFGLDAGALPSAAQLVASGAPRPGLDISKTIRFNDDPSVIAFTRLATAVDGQEDHKLAKFVALVEKRLQAAPAEQGARTIGPVYVRGYRSEDEPARIATTRAGEVARRLKESGLSVDVAVVGMTRGIKGNFNYREMRRVELRCADEVDLSEHTPEPEDSPAAGDGRVLGSDARYAAYGVLDALQAGERLIDVALSKLATISVATPADDAVMKIFRQFFHSADPNVVAGNLRFARKQIPLYVPEAPADPSRPEGGHACLDESRPGILFLNQGVGPTARMIAGVDSLHATPGNRAYNIVHEATHGAPEVQTVDVAYQWQRLFHFLSPADQLRNADSYGMLVGTLAGLTQATTDMTQKEQATKDLPAIAKAGGVACIGLPAELEGAVQGAWAWLEHYTTQVWLNVRDLYPTIAAGHALPPGTYQAQLDGSLRRHFGLGPGSVERASVAGILDRLDDLKAFANQIQPTFRLDLGQPDDPNDKFPIYIPQNQPANVPAVWQFLWRVMLATMQPPIETNLRAPFLAFVTDVVRFSRWGGPLG
jgi:hypothetical protein